MDTKGRAVVGHGVSDRNVTVSPIPLNTPRSRTGLFLFVAYTLDLDEEDQEFLTVEKSSYQLQTDQEKTVVSYDYVRDPSNAYPEAHLQIRGECSGLAELASVGLKQRSPSKLHLPTGGRRFRPCLEDIIEFCIVEELVIPHNPDWKEVVKARRDHFYSRQLRAAVRQNPKEAVGVLSWLGYSVAEPVQDNQR